MVDPTVKQNLYGMSVYTFRSYANRPVYLPGKPFICVNGTGTHASCPYLKASYNAALRQCSPALIS